MPFVDLSLLHLILVGVVVVWVEAGLLRRGLRLGRGAAFGASLITNLASYLAGLPLLWAMSNAGPFFPRLNGYQNLALSAALVLGLYALTCLVEAPLLRVMIKAPSWRALIKVCLIANLVSYLLLVPMMGPFSFFPNYGIRSLMGP